MVDVKPITEGNNMIERFIKVRLCMLLFGGVVLGLCYLLTPVLDWSIHHFFPIAGEEYSKPATTPDENFDKEWADLLRDNHNLDQASGARPEQPNTAEGAAAEVRALDGDIVEQKGIYEREHALLAKYNKGIAPKSFAYENATLRLLQANRDYYSYLAKTDFGHGPDANPAEYRQLKKALDGAFAEEKRTSNALRQARAQGEVK